MVKTATPPNPQAAAPVTNGQEKRTSNWRADGGITQSHVRVLTFLEAQAGPVTCQAIAEGVEAKQPKMTRWDLGTISGANRDPLSLMGRNPPLVKQRTQEVEDGVMQHVYVITPAGKAALTAHRKAAAKVAADAEAAAAAKEQAKLDREAAKEARAKERDERAAAKEQAKVEREAKRKAAEEERAAKAAAREEERQAKAAAAKAAKDATAAKASK